ncbi:MAG: hypothetical protein QM831_07985 [Kofleriaceae bacterium]
MKRLLVLLAACGHDPAVPPDASPPDAPPDASPLHYAITGTVDSTRFISREHFLAGGEMQISGEPLAEAMGRDLGGYSRDQVPPNLYSDPNLGVQVVDLPGFASAVESYEYSKQPMNFVAFESGAGTSLTHAVSNVPSLVEKFGQESNAFGLWVFAPNTYPANNGTGQTPGNRNPSTMTSPAFGDPARNPLGWPGMWPTTHVFASFDPTIDPTSDVKLLCAISSDDSPQGIGTRELTGDYECEATTLHLRDRAVQIDPTLTPGADGFATWKYGLWTINYLQVMHDDGEAAVDTVPEAELAQVGQSGYPVHLGSSDIEGFQAAMFLLEVDARADDWLNRLSTTDGTTLGGFTNPIGYSYTSPLRWFPAIAVTETAGADSFPVPAYSVKSTDSDALDLVGLAMGYAEFYALTDHANADVGGSQPARAYFDGDPFPADNQLADSEATLHDRALAMMRVAVIDLDRLHFDGTQLVDHVAFSGATPARGHVATTIEAAYAILGLRTVLRSLGSELELYSNNTPDSPTAGALDGLPINFNGLTFGDRTRQLIRAEADLLFDHLTDASGRAYLGWDTQAGAPSDPADSLDAHTAAIRGLFAAYLATGDTKYRDRALAVYARMDATFYDAGGRVYRDVPVAGSTAYSVTYTPLRFALLQSTLRDMYELVATRPGGDALVLPLEDRIGRLDKLVLNGWDDRNFDQRVSVDECIRYDGVHIALGGLQMAEKALTGDLGRATDEGSVGPPSVDRDADCVPEIDDAHLPSALADSLTLTVTGN